MAGIGSRFLDKGYKIPKQLISIKDKQLIDLSMDSINYKDCNLIFVVRDEYIYNHNIDVILRQKFGDDITVITLDHVTQGSVCSCLYAKSYIDNDTPLIIHCLDVEFRPVFNPQIIDELSTDGLLLTFKSNSVNYSYSETDDKGLLIRTAEKKVISDSANVGIYVFSKGSDFCFYAEKMIEEKITTNNEYYIAPLYNILAKDAKKISTKGVEKMHIFGTPEEYEFYKNNVHKVIDDRPIALCCDHSGFKLKEEFKKILTEENLNYFDFGSATDKDCDYKDFINLATRSMQEKDCDYGFGFCRTGQGVNISANKIKNIRSALVYDNYSMEMAIRHNCANFFSIPTKITTVDMLREYIKICKTVSFDGGRHQKRVQELE